MAQYNGKILIVDDNKDLLNALKLILTPYFSVIDTIRNPNQIQQMMEKKQYDLVLLDMNFSAGIATGNEGIFWFGRIREIDPKISVVFITAFGDVELAVRSLKEGATDFIMKSWDEQKILSTILAAYRLQMTRQELSLLKKKHKHLSGEIRNEFAICKCPSRSMQKVMELIDKVAKSDASVLILGENGTGKEAIAREIHTRSERKREIFVKVDLGALPESLFESELFGHTTGAFTGAEKARDGRFSIASGGTIFLDEIGNLPLSLQSKILSVIQNKEIYPLGSSVPEKTDTRIISATNMPLEEMIKRNEFRKDLFYRINAIQIDLPALRDRKEDIPVLAKFFLEKYSDRYKKQGIRIHESAAEKLMEHSWPGNIRELEHTIEKGVILSDGAAIHPEHFFPGEGKHKSDKLPDTLNLESHEKYVINLALKKYRGNVSVASAKLGINRSTLYQKIKKYGI